VLLYGLAAKFNLRLWCRYIKNSLTAGLTGFSTMSSLASLPVTLTVAEKNTQNPKMARAIIPATVNIHMIGDSIAIPIFAMSILLSFGLSLPTFEQYLVFAVFFVLYKFAVAAVPGGSIIVILPVLQSYFGFSGPMAGEMSALITTLYILFDPLVTFVNVLGNSAFVILMARFFSEPELTAQKIN